MNFNIYQISWGHTLNGNKIALYTRKVSEDLNEIDALNMAKSLRRSYISESFVITQSL